MHVSRIMSVKAMVSNNYGPLLPTVLMFADCVGSNGNIRYMVATHTQSLLVYENTTLKWAAQMPSTPVQIKVGAFK